MRDKWLIRKIVLAIRAAFTITLIVPALAFAAPQNAKVADDSPAPTSLKYPPAKGCPAYTSRCELAFGHCIAGSKDITKLPVEDALLLGLIRSLKKEQEDYFLKARNEKDPTLLDYYARRAAEIGAEIEALLAKVLKWTSDPLTLSGCSAEFEECCEKAAKQDKALWPKR